MRRSITLEKKKVHYTLRTSRRATRVSLTVRCDGAIVLTAPFGLPPRFAARFLREKRGWLFEKLAQFRRLGGAWPLALPRASRTQTERARRLVAERLAHFNRHYCLAFSRVAIRDQKARWGSCSESGNLSFNWRLALLPPRLTDYVVVHELCHLAHFNHSPAFWDLVAEGCPDYAERKRELRAVPLG